eukprot:gnl/MRDRNA2_/MRDRNA2_109479_c0_seq1.p1 gnl/MRDRNA2_/MRDRNA2_109479_c0~~gnl/MRDRNA2_/MRDRNA2_109479_c0_seq1.p1  ORF type:complete len:196 (+),score=64.12 gnl/MRDRNA2_/MRDRNA2_109479_c0_seq1:126-713(+)
MTLRHRDRTQQPLFSQDYDCDGEASADSDGRHSPRGAGSLGKKLAEESEIRLSRGSEDKDFSHRRRQFQGDAFGVTASDKDSQFPGRPRKGSGGNVKPSRDAELDLLCTGKLLPVDGQVVTGDKRPRSDGSASSSSSSDSSKKNKKKTDKQADKEAKKKEKKAAKKEKKKQKKLAKKEKKKKKKEKKERKKKRSQ